MSFSRFCAIRRLSLSGKSGAKIRGIFNYKDKNYTVPESLVIQKETELESENIFIINENEISVEQEIYLIFYTKIES
jgi:polyphosphate kinase